MDKKLTKYMKFNEQTYPTVQAVTDHTIKHKHAL